MLLLEGLVDRSDIAGGDLAIKAPELLQAEGQSDEVVGPYLADVAAGDEGPEPTHFREDFRRTGPSNYAHGKQEEAGNV